MQYLPIFLRSNDANCLVVGGGEVAARKIETLLKADAKVTVVSPELCPTVQALASSNRIVHEQRPYVLSDLDGRELVFAATDNLNVNRTVSEEAQRHNVPVNVVDQPALCSFIMPSIIDRSPVIVAISTGGSAPVLARLLRARLETMIPSGYGELALLMQSAREKVKAKFSGPMRRRFWESVVTGSIAERIFEGKRDAAIDALENLIDDPAGVSDTGEVYLVGAGPGDPDLLTFRALRLMQQADVIVYDRLVAPALVALCRKDAQRIYVGKQRDQHTVEQKDINQLLIDLAQSGKRVCRLKGGDPFIFGRGGEEIEQLAELGINFQIVPGVTAASGCAAYAGIPLTHRDYAQQCVFVTGHMKDGKLDLPWQSLAQPQQTIVVYMGLHSLEEFTAKITQAGLSEQTPIAIIERGTTPEQRVLTSTLKDVSKKVTEVDIESPALAIVGEVVGLRARYAWFETVHK
jgi:uroporphyrin-III C-methyltransferase / precorrin-2 dehydrogenase / sirohydrochlorin ferrochelatase